MPLKKTAWQLYHLAVVTITVIATLKTTSLTFLGSSYHKFCKCKRSDQTKYNLDLEILEKLLVLDNF